MGLRGVGQFGGWEALVELNLNEEKKKKKNPTGKQPSVQVIKSPFPGRAAWKGRLALLFILSIQCWGRGGG